MIPDGLKKMTRDERKVAGKNRRDAKIAELGHPKDMGKAKNAG